MSCPHRHLTHAADYKGPIPCGQCGVLGAQCFFCRSPWHNSSGFFILFESCHFKRDVVLLCGACWRGWAIPWLKRQFNRRWRVRTSAGREYRHFY